MCNEGNQIVTLPGNPTAVSHSGLGDIYVVSRYYDQFCTVSDVSWCVLVGCSHILCVGVLWGSVCVCVVWRLVCCCVSCLLSCVLYSVCMLPV